MLGFQPKLIVIGSNQGIGLQQRGWNHERAAGEGGGVPDAGARYKRSEVRRGYRSGHYDRNLTTSGNKCLR